jgi:hypothetical protein
MSVQLVVRAIRAQLASAFYPHCPSACPCLPLSATHPFWQPTLLLHRLRCCFPLRHRPTLCRRSSEGCQNLKWVWMQWAPWARESEEGHSVLPWARCARSATRSGTASRVCVQRHCMQCCRQAGQKNSLYHKHTHLQTAVRETTSPRKKHAEAVQLLFELTRKAPLPQSVY